MAGTLEKGIYIQVYRDKIPGKTHADKMKNVGLEMDKWKALGVKGVAWHGFVGDMDRTKFAELTQLCVARGLLSLGAFGLGSTRPVDYGNWIGDIANAPGCYAVVFDMEGAWEDEVADKAKCTLMGKTFRAKAPNALVIDQPWPVPTLHNSFPWEESAAWVDVRAPQVYSNNFSSSHGRESYSYFWNWHLKEWPKLEARLAPKGLVKPKIPTVEGYSWFFSNSLRCVLEHDTLIVWSEPFPEQEFLFAMEVANKLASLGFHGARAVWDFQTSMNGLLEIDGICGAKTIKELGLVAPSSLRW